MKNKLFILFVTILASGIPSCQKNEVSTLSDDRFAKLYARLMVISETCQTGTDSLAALKSKKIDSLFKAWNTTEKEFQATVLEYQKTPEKWDIILKSAAREVDSLGLSGRPDGVNKKL